MKEKCIPFIQRLRESRNPWQEEALLAEMPEVGAGPKLPAPKKPALGFSRSPQNADKHFKLTPEEIIAIERRTTLHVRQGAH